jgi:excinuclease UvrABC helicase subunit UvrB
MDRAMRETERRRNVQLAHNERNGIIPTTIVKAVPGAFRYGEASTQGDALPEAAEELSAGDLIAQVLELEEQMRSYSVDLRFEEAARCRDLILELKQKYGLDDAVPSLNEMMKRPERAFGKGPATSEEPSPRRRGRGRGEPR